MRGGLARAGPLLRQPRYEVFPAPSTEETVLEWVPPELTVTVTASPAKGLGPTLDLTEKLSARGYRVIPHLVRAHRLVRQTEQWRRSLLERIGAGASPPAASPR
jgi:methylenetetrahydrofolate reductase (NADPH)